MVPEAEAVFRCILPWNHALFSWFSPWIDYSQFNLLSYEKRAWFHGSMHQKQHDWPSTCKFRQIRIKKNGSTPIHEKKRYTRTLVNSKSNCKPIRFFNTHANSGHRRFVKYRNTAHIHVTVTNWNLRSFAWILGCPLEHCCCYHSNHCCYCFGYYRCCWRC